MTPPTPDLRRRLLAEADRQLSPTEAQAYLDAPISGAERRTSWHCGAGSPRAIRPPPNAWPTCDVRTLRWTGHRSKCEPRRGLAAARTRRLMRHPLEGGFRGCHASSHSTGGRSERTAIAMIVSVGFWQAPEGNSRVHHEQVRHVVRLLELIEHRCPSGRAHARAAHFVDAVTGHAILHHERLDVLRAGRVEHLGRRLGHVGNHRLLVFAPRHADAQRRNAEDIHGLGIDLDEVDCCGRHSPKPLRLSDTTPSCSACFQASPNPGAPKLKSRCRRPEIRTRA